MPGSNNQRIILAQCNRAVDQHKGARSNAKHSDCPYFHPENVKVTCDCECHKKGAI